MVSLVRRLRKPGRSPKLAHAHPLVAEVACEMANAVFDEAMSKDNEMWRTIKANNPGKSMEAIRRHFVKWLAPDLLDDARTTLAQSLSSNLSEALKERIYDALTRDAVLSRGRSSRRPMITAGTMH